MKNLIKKKTIKAKNSLLYRLTDYYFVSYPKCGRTWTRYFLAAYLKEKYNRNFSLEFDNLIKLDYRYPRIIYTHAHHRQDNLEDTKDFAQWLANHDKKVIFLVRDPRDVIVSSYFEYTKRGKGEVVDEDIELSEFIKLDHTGIEKIVDYMNLWYQAQDQFDDFLLLRYEDLKERPEKKFSRLIKFLNIDLDEEVLQEAVEKSSFENMREAEKSGEVQNKRLKPADKSDELTYKTRRGESGQYVEYFDREELDYLDGVVSEMVKNIRY